MEVGYYNAYTDIDNIVAVVEVLRSLSSAALDQLVWYPIGHLTGSTTRHRKTHHNMGLTANTSYAYCFLASSFVALRVAVEFKGKLDIRLLGF